MNYHVPLARVTPINEILRSFSRRCYALISLMVFAQAGSFYVHVRKKTAIKDVWHSESELVQADMSLLRKKRIRRMCT